MAKFILVFFIYALTIPFWFLFLAFGAGGAANSNNAIQWLMVGLAFPYPLFLVYGLITLWFDIKAKKHALYLMPKLIQNQPKLAEEGKVYIREDGNYVTCCEGKIYSGSLLVGEHCNPNINLSGLSDAKLADAVLIKQVLGVTSKRGHTQEKRSGKFLFWLFFPLIYIVMDFSIGIVLSIIF